MVRKYAGADADLILKGCRGKVKIRMEPESGFFAVFDFTALKGLSDRDGIVMKNERDFARAGVWGFCSEGCWGAGEGYFGGEEVCGCRC